MSNETTTRLVEEFYDSTAEKDWPAWGTEAVAILEKMTTKPEQHTYNCDDADLQDLLNQVAHLQFTADTGGFLNHDDGMGFLMALEKVQERLKASDGVMEVPRG